MYIFIYLFILFAKTTGLLDVSQLKLISAINAML